MANLVRPFLKFLLKSDGGPALYEKEKKLRPIATTNIKLAAYEQVLCKRFPLNDLITEVYLGRECFERRWDVALGSRI